METAALIISIVALISVLFYPLAVLCLSFLVSLAEGRRKRKWMRSSSELTTEAGKTESRKKASSMRALYDGLYKFLSLSFSRLPSNKLRLFAYRRVFKMTIQKGAGIHKGVEIRCGHKISIGERSIIGDDCILDGRGTLIIGADVNLSSRVSVYTGQHKVNDPGFGGVFKKVVIADKAWISANTIILPGVTVNQGAVLAAGGVATKDLEAFGVYGGVPAKKISERERNLDYQFKGCSTWFY